MKTPFVLDYKALAIYAWRVQHMQKKLFCVVPYLGATVLCVVI